MWTSFVLGLGAGIAATPHCLGMCGGFPLHLARSSREGRVVLRQVLFVLGKTFTYVFLGTLAGALGLVLLRDTSAAGFAPHMRIFAGLITIFFGLLMLGIRLPSFKPLQNIADTGFVKGLFGGVLVSPNPAAGFVLGLGVGFLPCPLPIGMLTVAAASHDIAHAMALMAGVGIGTAPGLLALGIFGVGLNRKFAKVGMRAAGTVVIIIGLLTLGRATGVIAKAHPVNKALPACCQHK